MADYTELGIEKLTQQAGRRDGLVRCPRDGAVMRVIGGRAERRDGSGEVAAFERRFPDKVIWQVRELTVECPACQRRAERIRPRQREVAPSR